MYNRQDLIRLLMNSIGLQTDQDGYVTDQDFGTPIIINGKTLKFSTGNLRIDFRNEIAFNPLNDRKQMFLVFQYYLTKLTNLDGRIFQIFYPVDHPDKNFMGKCALYIKEGVYIHKSRYYYNESLRYIDLILRLEGYGDEIANLTELDCKIERSAI